MKLPAKFLTALLACLPLTACGDSDVSAKDLMDKAQSSLGDLKDLDVSSLTGDALKEKSGELVNGLAEQLAGIKDLASAEQAKTAIQPLIETALQMKDKLGAQLPDIGNLTEAISSLKTKFPEGGDVMSVLKPILEQLQKLVA